MLRIFTDGASSPNTSRAGGWGFCVVRESGEVRHRASGGALDTTNNIMEMTAVLKAMQFIARYYPSEDFPKHVTIVSDSKYVLNGLHGVDGPPPWHIKWAKQGWKTAAGGDVKNAKLWRDMVAIKTILSKTKVTLDFEWIKGHSDDEFNDIADKLATDAKVTIATEAGLL